MSRAGRVGVVGYTGITRQIPLSDKPGDSHDLRTNKFSRAGEAVVFGDNAPEFDGSQTTSIQDAAATVRASDYKIPHRSGILEGVIDAQPRPVKFRAMTESQYALANYHQVATDILNYADDDFEAAFNRIDTDGSGFIDRAELRALMRSLKDAEPTDYEVQLFVTHFDKNSDRRISLDEFRSGVDAIRYTAQRNVANGGKKEPAWKSQVTKRVIGTEPHASSISMDMGADGYVPAHRPLIEGSGMNSSTKDLFEGTSKWTMQLPGYSGFIPGAKHNPSAVTQGNGDSARDTFLHKTNLRGTFNTRTPGYAGHRPLYGPDAGRQELTKPIGIFAATEQAAADALIADYWAQRKAAGGGGKR